MKALLYVALIIGEHPVFGFGRLIGHAGLAVMKAKAITAARLRLDQAEDATARLERGGLNFRQLEAAWLAFLLAAGGVYAKLEQGAKGEKKSEGWFGRMKHQRRTDPLLVYLHQARNSEEHTIEGSTNQEKMDMVADSKETRLVRNAEGDVVHVYHPQGVPISLRPILPYLRLLTVVDTRFNDSFPPPTTHLGDPLSETSPSAVARAGLTYLQGMIAEAEALPPH